MNEARVSPTQSSIGLQVGAASIFTPESIPMHRYYLKTIFGPLVIVLLQQQQLKADSVASTRGSAGSAFGLA